MSDVVIIDYTKAYTTLVDDTDATYRYVGEATAGSNTPGGRADGRWRVSRITKATGTVEWSNGAGFNSIWDNRATTLTYA